MCFIIKVRIFAGEVLILWKQRKKVWNLQHLMRYLKAIIDYLLFFVVFERVYLSLNFTNSRVDKPLCLEHISPNKSRMRNDVCIWDWWHQVILFPGCLEDSLISHHCCSHKDLHLDGLPRIWLEAQLISHQTLVHIHQVITYPPWTVLCWSCPTQTSWHQKALNSVSTFSLGSIHFTYFYLKTLFWRNKSPYLICKPLVLQDRYDLWITLSWVACVLLVHY